MWFRALVQGSGAVDVRAYGVGDAEAQIEKELLRAIPNARVAIRTVRRVDPGPKIVEEFRLDYTIVTQVSVEGQTEERAGRAAFSSVRHALLGTRFERVSLDKVELEAE